MCIPGPFVGTEHHKQQSSSGATLHTTDHMLPTPIQPENHCIPWNIQISPTLPWIHWRKWEYLINWLSKTYSSNHCLSQTPLSQEAPLFHKIKVGGEKTLVPFMLIKDFSFKLTAYITLIVWGGSYPSESSRLIINLKIIQLKNNVRWTTCVDVDVVVRPSPRHSQSFQECCSESAEVAGIVLDYWGELAALEWFICTGATPRTAQHGSKLV